MDDAAKSQPSSLRLISSVAVAAAVFLLGAAAVVVGWIVAPELLCRDVPREDERQAICELGWAFIAPQVTALAGGVLAGLLRPSWRHLGVAIAGVAAGVMVVGLKLDIVLTLSGIAIGVLFFGGIALAIGYGFGAVIEYMVRHPDT